jgi:A/G-specific adenine glycosylase
MPWRNTRDPYAIWISEVMLQQTTVATATPYFERFMKRFPDVAALAAADEDSVLASWSGLGYYSRARNLRAAAQAIVRNHAGRFPRTVEAALMLPGVGPYTASAVTSIAYGTKAAVVDGNVRRVLSRLHAKRMMRDAELQARALALLAPRSPGNWNEAMMELGATVCTALKPACERCPVSSQCQGRARAEHWSEGTPRRASVPLRLEMALVEQAGRILLARTPKGELMAGLYELPHSGLPRNGGRMGSLNERYPDTFVVGGGTAAKIRHTVTHHRIEATIHKATLARRTPPDGSRFQTLKEAWSLPLGGLTRKALRAAGLEPNSSL